MLIKIEKLNNFLQMNLLFKAISKIIKKMQQENICGLMDLLIKEILKIDHHWILRQIHINWTFKLFYIVW